MNGSRSRSASTLKTLPGPPEERASNGVTSSSLIPTSPNYFDLLLDGEDNSESDPLPAVKTPTAKKTVRYKEKSKGIHPPARVDGDRPLWSRSSETRGDSRRYKENGIRGSSSNRGADQHSRNEGESPPYSADEAEEFAAANAGDRELGVCPTPDCSTRPRRSNS